MTGCVVRRQFGRAGAAPLRRAAAAAPRAAPVAPRAAISNPGSDVTVDIQGKHLEVTPAIEEYVQRAVSGAIDSYNVEVHRVTVRLSVRGGAGSKTKGSAVQKAELTVFTKHGTLRCERESDNLYASVDKVTDVVSRKLRKTKDKLKGKMHRDGTNNVPVAQMSAEDADNLKPLPDLSTLEVKAPDRVIARRKYFDMPEVTPEAAIEQLENVDHDFYLFKNAETGGLQLVYKRNSGGYGLIVPKDQA